MDTVADGIEKTAQDIDVFGLRIGTSEQALHTAHQALAVALGSMAFTTLSGAVSHYREHEVVPLTGAVLGMGGLIGALIGAVISNHMEAPHLSLFTGFMLLSSAVLLYLRIYRAEWLGRQIPVREELLTGRRLYLCGLLIGFICGVLSGVFGIGSAAYIQIALMVVFGVPLLQAIGTTMMIIVPISVSGGGGSRTGWEWERV